MKIRLTIGKLMIEIETESEEVIIEREVVPDPSQTRLGDFSKPHTTVQDHPFMTGRLNDVSNRGRPKGARDLQPREPSHCSTCGAVHRKATMRRAGADGRPHCVECDPNVVRWV